MLPANRRCGQPSAPANGGLCSCGQDDASAAVAGFRADASSWKPPERFAERAESDLGPILPRGTEPTRTAFVSCSSECTTHPRKVVTNAFRRRGFGTSRHGSQGQTWIRFPNNMPARPEAVPLPFIPWAPKVES